jgi:Cu+-exporting ATPase
MVKDPVCGMQIDPKNAAGTSEYNGKTYYFCSEHCKKKFELDPAYFVGDTRPGSTK